MSTEQGQQQGKNESATPAVSHRAVLVLGMHRSGTSAFTRVLSLLGADLPSALQPPDVGNDLGFWEPAELVVIHDEMLVAAGSSWDDYRRLPEAWANGEAATLFRSRILDVLRKDFSASKLFVLKDPRVCRFVPLWQKMLAEFGAEPLYALVYRNPLEVAESLRVRNEFGTTLSCLLWLRHVLDAERSSRGGKRTWISYDRMLRDWRPQLTRAVKDLGLELPGMNDPAAVAEIEAYLVPQQRHHRRTFEDLREDAEVPAWVVQVYEAIEMEEARPGSGHAVFDEISRRLDEAEDILNRLGGGKRAYVVEVTALKHAVEMHKREAAVVSGQCETLKDAIAAMKKHVADLERGLAEKAPLLAALKSSNDRETRLLADVEKLRTQQAALQSQAAALEVANGQAIDEFQRQIKIERELSDQERHRHQEQLQQREQHAAHFQRVAYVFDRRLDRLRQQITKMQLGRGVFSRTSSQEWVKLTEGVNGNRFRRRWALEKTEQLIAASGLFDEAFYRSMYDDIARTGVDPLKHYCTSGWKEKRQPHPLFDVEYYLSRNPDLAHVNPLLHYLLVGAWESRDPNPLFSSRWYLGRHLDVAAAGINPLSHYILQGAAEGRWPNSTFDPTGYAMTHPGDSDADNNPLVSELATLKALNRLPSGPAATQAHSGRDRQFFDVFDFTIRNRPAALTPPTEPLDLNHLKISIVTPTFEAGSGGIMTIMRLVQQLEFAGHEVTILVKPVLDERRKASDFHDLIQRHFLPVRAKVRMLDEVPADEVKGDALIATDRWTCFPVRSLTNFRRRFYLVQDYETLFYPTGAEALLTDATYHFGFDAICAGPWLAELSSKKFGMRAWSFELAADQNCYSILPDARRGQNRIAFYARMATARRAVELGYLAFEVLRQRNVDFHVDFFGADIGGPRLGYSYTNHGIMTSKQLGELYNVATVGLVFSATNYSLIPREMMACGLPVIELDSESSRMSFPDMTAELVRPDPVAMADVLQAMLSDPVRREAQSRRGLAFAAKFDWAESGKMVERALKEGLSS